MVIVGFLFEDVIQHFSLVNYPIRIFECFLKSIYTVDHR